MKQFKAITLSMVLAFTASTSFAATSAKEVKARFEKEVKEKDQAEKARLTRLGNEKAQVSLTQDLSALNTKIASADLATALKKSVNDGTTNISILDLAISLKSAHEVLKDINENDLAADAKELVQVKKAAIQQATAFLSLAKNMSTATAENQAQINAFAKQLSLISDMVTSMDKAELQSHAEIMALAVSKAAGNRALTGDQAYYQALLQKYNNDATVVAKKIEEILSCVR